MKRLDFARDQLCEPLPWMESSSTGDYVEHDEAMVEILRLKALLEKAQAFLDGHWPDQMALISEIDAALEGKAS